MLAGNNSNMQYVIYIQIYIAFKEIKDITAGSAEATAAGSLYSAAISMVTG